MRDETGGGTVPLALLVLCQQPLVASRMACIYLLIVALICTITTAINAQGRLLYYAFECSRGFSTENIVVGFQKASYTTTEGDAARICVKIISPSDVGSAEVYVQVHSNPDGVPAGIREASKFHQNIKYKVIQVELAIIMHL